MNKTLSIVGAVGMITAVIGLGIVLLLPIAPIFDPLIIEFLLLGNLCGWLLVILLASACVWAAAHRTERPERPNKRTLPSKVATIGVCVAIVRIVTTVVLFMPFWFGLYPREILGWPLLTLLVCGGILAANRYARRAR